MFRKFFNLRSPSSFKKRESVMDKHEEAFFFELQKQLPAGLYIFPKMRIADIIETTSGKGYYIHRNEILPKHIDFLICDAYFHPVLAIELNGSSHEREDRKKSDEEKRKIFREVGLPFEFIEVGTDFSLEVVGLISRYVGLLGKIPCS